MKNISFQLGRGEIIGIFGLMGAGRTELMETYLDAPQAKLRRNFCKRQKVKFDSPADAIEAGIALVPEDRKKDGLVLGLDVRANISLTTLEQMVQDCC